MHFSSLFIFALLFYIKLSHCLSNNTSFSPPPSYVLSDCRLSGSYNHFSWWICGQQFVTLDTNNGQLLTRYTFPYTAIDARPADKVYSLDLTQQTTRTDVVFVYQQHPANIRTNVTVCYTSDVKGSFGTCVEVPSVFTFFIVMDDSDSGWVLFSPSSSSMKTEWVNIKTSSMQRKSLAYDSNLSCTQFYKHLVYQICETAQYALYATDLNTEKYKQVLPSATTRYEGFRALPDGKAVLMSLSPYNFLYLYQNDSLDFSIDAMPTEIPESTQLNIQSITSYGGDNPLLYYIMSQDYVFAFMVSTHNYRKMAGPGDNYIFNSIGFFIRRSGSIMHIDAQSGDFEFVTNASSNSYEYYENPNIMFWYGDNNTLTAFLGLFEIHTTFLKNYTAYSSSVSGNSVLFEIKESTRPTYHIWCVSQKKWATPIENVMEKSVGVDDPTLVAFRTTATGNVIRVFDTQSCSELRSDTINYYGSTIGTVTGAFELLGNRSSLLYIVPSQDTLAPTTPVYHCFYAASEANARACSGANDALIGAQNHIAVFAKNGSQELAAYAPLRSAVHHDSRVPTTRLHFPNHLMIVYCENKTLDVFNDDTLAISTSGTMSSVCGFVDAFYGSNGQLTSAAIFSPTASFPVTLYDHPTASVTHFDYQGARMGEGFARVVEGSIKGFFKAIIDRTEAIYQMCSTAQECNDYNNSTTDKCIANICSYVPISCPLTSPFRCANNNCMQSIDLCFIS